MDDFRPNDIGYKDSVFTEEELCAGARVPGYHGHDLSAPPRAPAFVDPPSDILPSQISYKDSPLLMTEIQQRGLLLSSKEEEEGGTSPPLANMDDRTMLLPVAQPVVDLARARPLQPLEILPQDDDGNNNNNNDETPMFFIRGNKYRARLGKSCNPYVMATCVLGLVFGLYTTGRIILGRLATMPGTTAVPTTMPTTVPTGAPTHFPKTPPLTTPSPTSSPIASPNNNLPLLVGGNWTQMGQTLTGEANYGDIGNPVGLSAHGQTIAVGTLMDNKVGRVRVFHYQDDDENNGTSWVQVGQDLYGDPPLHESCYTGDDDFCNINNTTWPTFFGATVVLDNLGHTMAVSAPRQGAPANDENTGQVQVFIWNGATQLWEQQGQTLLGEENFNYFGVALSLSKDGNILAVGGPHGDWYTINGGATNNGKVRVFGFNTVTTQWEPLGQSLVGDEMMDQFGMTVSLSYAGNVLAVGDPGNNQNGKHAGLVRVFEYNHVGRLWVQRGQDLRGATSHQEFGKVGTVLSGNGLILAASGRTLSTLRVYQFDVWSGFWDPLGQPLAGEDDFAVEFLALSENGFILAVGDPNDHGSASRPGRVRVYQYSNELRTWQLVGDELQGQHVNDGFGETVALSNDGTIVATSVHGNTDISGQVIVYEYEIE